MESKKELSEKAYNIGKEQYEKFGSCAQCVLVAVQKTLGTISDEQIKSAHSLSAGGGKMGFGMCGALSGGMLAIGAFNGRDVENFGNGKFSENLKLNRSLIERFQKEFSGISCNDFQKKCHGTIFDMWNQNDVDKYKDEKFQNYCSELVGSVAKWCVEILA